MADSLSVGYSTSCTRGQILILVVVFVGSQDEHNAEHYFIKLTRQMPITARMQLNDS